MNIAANIIEIGRKRGSDARDVRDAAHEIAHVFQIKRARPFRGQYDRENIHAQLGRLGRREAHRDLFAAQMIVYEYEARAVEWLVCDALKEPYEVDHWVDIMLLETASTLHCVPPGGVDDNRNRIEVYRKRRKTVAIVEQILALGGK